MYLLDTNVISELRKAGSGKANPQVIAWAAATDNALFYLSAISVLELETGILRKERKDAQQGKILRVWLEQQVLPAFAGKILPVDTQVARYCAGMHVPDPGSYRDTLIAATALAHDLTVVTRNTADFTATGVRLLNPW